VAAPDQAEACPARRRSGEDTAVRKSARPGNRGLGRGPGGRPRLRARPAPSGVNGWTRGHAADLSPFRRPYARGPGATYEDVKIAVSRAGRRPVQPVRADRVSCHLGPCIPISGEVPIPSRNIQYCAVLQPRQGRKDES